MDTDTLLLITLYAMALYTNTNTDVDKDLLEEYDIDPDVAEKLADAFGNMMQGSGEVKNVRDNTKYFMDLFLAQLEKVKI